MLTTDELSQRRADISGAADMAGGVAAMESRLARLLEEPPPFPDVKAMLSVDGGVCPDDATALAFDPWSPRDHHCPTCNQTWSGDRHHRAWARWQHLWLAERAGELAAFAVLTDNDTARARASDILCWYGDHYPDFPNVDNVLGPARVFFSTYLESIWLENLMAAGFLLAELGKLDEAANDAISTIADQAATIIGEYDERLSNRQTWNNAALLSIAVWFEDEELAHRCIEGPTGLIAHLLHGFGADGLWYEGENYHFFALQGLLRSAGWARLAGVDIFMEPDLAEPIHRVLLAGRETALPDLTFPARKGARYGVALSQPMYLESWEIGLARSARSPAAAPPGLGTWLAALHSHPAGTAELFDSYLHEVGREGRGRGGTDEHRTRRDLSWRALLEMMPSLPTEEEQFGEESVFLESHGLAVLRSDERYVSMECGATGGGHGHPDRLNLTLHAGGVHWLPDPGTGSYVASDLTYYRSTMAHNAPLVDGRSQQPGPAQCEAFDTNGAVGWIRASFEGLRRTVVAGPEHLIDVVESDAEDDHLLEIPWHFHGDIEVTSPGSWTAEPLDHFGTTDHQRFEPDEPGLLSVRVSNGASTLSVQFHGGSLWRVRGPGLPTEGESREFLLVRASGRHVRCTTLVAWQGEVQLTEVIGDAISVLIDDRKAMHRAVTEGWVFDTGSRITLAGFRSVNAAYQPLVTRDRPMVMQAVASWRSPSPDIENGLDGFRGISPLVLDHEDQYRRAEQDYAGPDEFSAQAFPAWNHDGFYLAVDVHKRDVYFRAPDAPPLMLDNEPDDIHSDGVQVYLQQPEGGSVFGLIAVPDPESDEVAVRMISGEGVVHARWRASDTGYLMVLSLVPSWWDVLVQGDRLGFDLLVNEARPGRQRRAGQLVWSGGGGWVWLRGDRQRPDAFGTLELR
jgi:hypothetical protein